MVEIEINLTEIQKIERKGLIPKKVLVHGKNKTFYRTQWVKPETLSTQNIKNIVEYENISGLYGKSPKYESMPKTIKIPDTSIEKMEKIKENSQSEGIEMGCIIKIKNNEFFLDKLIKGNRKGIKIGKGEKYGVYHTHPGSKNTVNSFSHADIYVMLIQGESHIPQKIMMAHDCNTNTLWCAIASSDTLKIAKNTHNKIRDNVLKYKKEFENKRWSIREKEVDKTYRKSLKALCDEYKIKLYYGEPNSELKEYNGEW